MLRLRVHLRGGSQVETLLEENEAPDDLEHDELGDFLRRYLCNQEAHHGFVVIGDTPVHVNAIEAIEPL